MKRLVLLLLLAVPLSAIADTAVLTWTSPSQNCDGTPLTNLSGFRVYWGLTGRVGAGLPATSSGACNDPTQVQPTDPKVAVAYSNQFNLASITTTTTVVLPDDGKRYYFSVTALDSTGDESPLANEVTKVTQVLTTPNPVTGLQVQ